MYKEDGEYDDNNDDNKDDDNDSDNDLVSGDDITIMIVMMIV